MLDAVRGAEEAHQRRAVQLAGKPLVIAAAPDGDEAYHHRPAAQGDDAVEHRVVALAEALDGRVAVVGLLRRARHGGPVEVRIVPAQHHQRVRALGDVGLETAQLAQRGLAREAEFGVVAHLRAQRPAEQVHKGLLAAGIALAVLQIDDAAGDGVADDADGLRHVRPSSAVFLDRL